MNIRRMAKRWFLVLCSIIFIGLGLPSTSHAYTEEEIQQAKAWLSAHGYSPDSGGASQAYQDYLNGKFDEELGINTTEASSGTTADTQEAATTEEVDKKQNATEGKNKDSNNGNTTEQQSGDSGGTMHSSQGAEAEADNTAQTEAGDVEQAPESQSEAVTDSPAESVDTETMSDEDNDDAKQTGGISIFRRENMDTYKEAGLVILLSVLLVAVVKAIRMLFR
ncbi:MAG: hypothetical protein IJ801_01005 [Lachnospiraceae bacterium]|nr:hypothetical protein [Lachnospiraceae bacterium]